MIDPTLPNLHSLDPLYELCDQVVAVAGQDPSGQQVILALEPILVQGFNRLEAAAWVWAWSIAEAAPDCAWDEPEDDTFELPLALIRWAIPGDVESAIQAMDAASDLVLIQTAARLAQMVSAMRDRELAEMGGVRPAVAAINVRA